MIVVIFPDGGRNYLSKLYNDEWMRANGLLTTTGAVVRIDELLRARHHGPDLPDVVLARTTDRVGAAIDLLQLYGISQLPVSERPDDDAVEGIVGSVSEKGLLDRTYRDPTVVERTIGEVMDPPLPTIDLGASLDEAFGAAVRRRAGGRRGQRRPAGGRRHEARPPRVPGAPDPAWRLRPTTRASRRSRRSRPNGLELESMSVPFMEALVARDLAAAEREIGAHVPAWLPDQLEHFLQYRLAQLAVDPSIREWLGRSMVLTDDAGRRRVVGTIGFHGPPDALGSASRSATAWTRSTGAAGSRAKRSGRCSTGPRQPTASAGSSPRSRRRTSRRSGSRRASASCRPARRWTTSTASSWYSRPTGRRPDEAEQLA